MNCNCVFPLTSDQLRALCVREAASYPRLSFQADFDTFTPEGSFLAAVYPNSRGKFKHLNSASSVANIVFGGIHHCLVRGALEVIFLDTVTLIYSA